MPTRKPKRNYVYAHASNDGVIFYIGKGSEQRAWCRSSRHSLWYYFLETRLADRYQVRVIVDDLNEGESLEIESALIERCGAQLVNWVNSGRKFDYAANARFHKLRAETRQFIVETKLIEGSNPEEAVRRYRDAIEQMHAYRKIEYETGLIADLCRERWPPSGDWDGLDRLTMVLRRLGRIGHLIEAVEDYFQRYPMPMNENNPVMKRYTSALRARDGRVQAA